jgi:hypothetical protein
MKKYITYPQVGSSISDAIKKGIELAALKNVEVTFDFNGVNVNTRADSNADLIHRDWQRVMSGYVSQNVGPYPNAVLTDEELAKDNAIMEAREALRKVEADAYHKEQEDARAKLAKEIEGIDFDVVNTEVWDECKKNNTDPYGSAINEYAELWGRLMQARMHTGKSVSDVAKDASRDADTDGITGFMYSCAVNILSHVWNYGEDLRRWHNIDTQIGTEGEKANESGGVLNPAIINIG